jgi:hypothetical protein
MGHITSNNISVFPCGRRGSSVSNSARLTTEYNLVSIINRLVDRDSFIVTDVDFTEGFGATNTTLFSFNIGGYLFTTSIKDIFIATNILTEAGNLTATGSNATKVYAAIKVEKYNWE